MLCLQQIKNVIDLWSITEQTHSNLKSIVLYNNELKYTEKSFNDDIIYTSVLQ